MSLDQTDLRPFRWFADADGLMTYGPSEAWLSGRAAYYVDRIPRGAALSFTYFLTMP
jgi:hypothetical protein